MKKIIIILFIGLIGIVSYVAWNVFGPTVSAPTEKYLYIKTGSSLDDVLTSLREKAIVKPGFFFNKLVEQAKYKNNIKPGRYEIKDGMSAYALVKMLKSGKQAPIKLVINKLRIKEDLAGKIGKNFEVDSLEVVNFLRNKDSLSSFNLDSNSLMTAVIPNTYELNWNTPIKKIFARLKLEQEKFWNTERLQKAKNKSLKPSQVYILASIVEEETNKAEDKPLVASVYKNRFLKGEKLQADPTVKFAMKDFGLKRILFKHLEFESPYNTYRHTGLPPGPICTPSSKTIDAVLDAAETNYMFFVAKPDLKGYSNFAVTYEEHMRFAKAYQNALDSFIRNKK
jgi:UPF0755 protein